MGRSDLMDTNEASGVNGETFYEREDVIHEVVEARRSQTCRRLVLQLINKKLGENRSRRILDVGCGDGSFITQFADCCDLYGVDISKKAVELARQAGVNSQIADISCQRLPYSGKFFDVVYMGDIIEHLVDPDFAIEEVLRVLKPERFLVISTPNLGSWLNRLLVLAGYQPRFTEVSTIRHFGGMRRQTFVPVGHLRIFTYKALRDFLSYHGFTILETRGSSSEGLPNLVDRMDLLISRLPSLASTLVFVAKASSLKSQTRRSFESV
jgi:ubiquinone/menaquinone biosynthesis C-methylase UbiE